MSAHTDDVREKRTSHRSKKIRDHRDLRVWRKAGKLADRCREAVGGFSAPQADLAAVICRLADEVPDEIATGQAQRLTAAYVSNLERARVALRHLERRLIQAHKLGAISASAGDPLLVQLAEIDRMLRKLIISLELARAERKGVLKSGA